MSNTSSKLVKSISVEGMTCVNCALNVERSVKKLGLENVYVNFSNKELLFEEDNTISNEQIENAIIKAGFSVSRSSNKVHEFIKKGIVLLSIIIAAYFMLGMLIHFHLPPIIDACLAAFSLSIGIWQFGKSAYYSIRSGSANMYVLILLGAITAFLFSIYLVLSNQGEHLYFETTAVLIALVFLGNFLEENALAKTIQSIEGILDKQVPEIKKHIDNTIQKVSINSLKINDVIQVNLGDEIVCDGIISDGEIHVNESVITGEPIEIRKVKGDKVLGGSQVIGGNALIEVTQVPALSTKSRINQLVQKASSQKANVQKLADKISAIFVPLILVVTVFSFLFNYFFLSVTIEQSILRSIAVLVISCPCAMGLATPIAVMVGIHKMTKYGVLVKTPDVFENLHQVKHFLFDKTGTITTGNLSIQSINYFESDQKFVEKILYTLESKSSHPIAQSILSEIGTKESYPLAEVSEISGSGMFGKTKEGDVYRLGNASFTKSTVDGDLFLTKNDSLLAIIFLKDNLKKEAKDVFNYLKNNDISSTVLSGDQQKRCDILAKELAITIVGEMQPKDKLNYIDKQNLSSTAMIGDGVNDSPLLSKVNVGFSFAEASDLAKQSADVILLNSSLMGVQHAHQIAKQTYQTIKQNLFWAFAYNIIAVPLAIFGIIHPMWAALFMIGSDLIVVGNAYLLKLKKIKK